MESRDRSAPPWSEIPRALGISLTAPPWVPSALHVEWRLVGVRWLGLAVAALALPFIPLAEGTRLAGWGILALALLYNAVVTVLLHRQPSFLLRNPLTTVVDALLTLAMVLVLGGSFDSPFYPLLISVSVSAAVRYGYGTALGLVGVYVGVDALVELYLGGALDGLWLLRSGFLLLVTLLAAYLRAQAERAEAQVEALAETGRVVASAAARDLDAVLDALCERAQVLFGADAVAVDLAEADSDRLVVRRLSPLVSAGTARGRVGVAYDPGPLTGEALRSRRPVYSADFQSDPRVVEPVRLASPRMVTTVTVPLVADEGPLGILSLQWTRRHGVDQRTLAVAEALGRHAAVAVRNARLWEGSSRARAEAEALAALATSLARADGPEDTVAIALDTLPRLLRLRTWGVYEPDREGVLRPTASFGMPDGVARAYAFRSGEGYVGRAYASGATEVTDDLHGDPAAHLSHLDEQIGVRAFVAAPMMLQERVLGVLAGGSDQPGALTAEDVRLVEVVAHNLAVALAQSRERAAARREAAEKAAILEQMASSVVVVDAQGLFTHVNPAAEAFFGAPSDVLVGTSAVTAPWRAFTPDGGEIEPQERPLWRALRGDATVTEFRLVAADGEERWGRSLARPLRDEEGALAGAVLVVQDLTEETRATAALKASEERLRLALAAGRMGTWELDLRSGLVIWDEVTRRLVGLGEFDGHYETFLAAVHPDDRNLLAAAIQPTDAREASLEYRVIHPDGDVRWLSTDWAIHPGDDGRPARLVGVIVDATARKEAERHKADMAQSEKMRALGQMAGGIAHDLNQSLGMVVGYAELARRTLESPSPDSAEVREMLSTVMQAGRDGAETVKRLLLFAKQRDEGAPERVDLATLLEDVARLTAPRWRDTTRAEGRPVNLEVAADPEVTVEGHPASLRQALTNLVMNALDALPEGGWVGLTARESGDWVEVAVSDSGVGMSAEVQERVFEPFYTTKGERGSGLGLAQVFAIAERHSGAIDLTSAPGQGTTVRLRIPRAAATGTESPAVPTREVAPLRVVAVDDEVKLVRLLGLILEADGHRADVATSAEDALRLLEGGEYDAVVSDLTMGEGLNGWELAREARRRWPRIRFVLATGWGAGIEAEEARARGVDAVVAKPYRIEDLRRALGTALGARPNQKRQGQLG